jgi:hypothetical protein
MALSALPSRMRKSHKAGARDGKDHNGEILFKKIINNHYCLLHN